jgi:Fe-S cluster assembly protein SufD
MMLATKEDRGVKVAAWAAEATGRTSPDFAGLTFPTSRDERWRYTRASNMLGRAMHPATAPGSAPAQRPLPNLDAHRLVFVDGHFMAALSTAGALNGAYIGTWGESIEANPELLKTWGRGAFADKEWFAALQAEGCQDGACIFVPKGVDISSKPVLVEHHLSGAGIAAHPRNIVYLEAGAKAEVLLWTSASPEADGLMNLAFDARIDEKAELKLEFVQDEAGQSAHVSHLHLTQAADSKVEVHTATARAHWLRNDLHIEQIGERANATFHGCFAPGDGQFTDHHTRIDHAMPDGTSSELYKGLAFKGGKAVFNGKIKVHQDAQRIEAFQKNSNILLERGATIYAKPELEIYADDVRCSHGCTTGQFDEEAVFYLRSRGMPEAAARRLLTQAFMAESIVGLRPEAREHVEALFLKRIHA